MRKGVRGSRLFGLLLGSLPMGAGAGVPNSCPDQKSKLQQLLTQVQAAESSQWMPCLHALQKRPGIPPEKASRYWITIEGKKVFGMRCNPMQTPESFTYAFIAEEGFRTVKFPRIPVKRKYSWGTETPIYPSKVVTFRTGGRLYYFGMETNDMFNVVPGSEKLTASEPRKKPPTPASRGHF